MPDTERRMSLLLAKFALFTAAWFCFALAFPDPHTRLFLDGGLILLLAGWSLPFPERR